MDLLDRYLQAVKWWLPKGQKQDIIAELSEDLRSQIEDRETALGRRLDEAELEAILKRCGRPLVVAGRYLPQRSLIGPTLFPFYAAVLRGVLFYYLIPWLAVWLGLVAFWPAYRAAHPGFSLLATLTTWVRIALNSFAIVTVGFALLERSHDGEKILDDWSPRRLPKVRDAKRIPRSTSISELLLHLGAIGCWVSLPRARVLLPQPGTSVRWTPGPVWESFHGGLFYPVLLLMLAGAALSIANLVRPYWTRVRLGVRAATHATAVVLVASVLARHLAEVREQWLAVRGPRAVDGFEAGLVWTNLATFWALAVVGLISAGVCAFEIWQILRGPRGRAARPGAIGGLAASL